MTKVTYNKYSCAISGMSREMMKMDDRDSAEYKNWEKRDKMVILEFVLNEEKTKYGIVLLLQLKCKKENVKIRGEPVAEFSLFFL